MTLTQSEAYAAAMQWGRPQPETVRDYTVRAEIGSGANAALQELFRISGNYLRRRVHRLAAAIDTAAVRITVTSTNGINRARIVEVRIYGQ